MSICSRGPRLWGALLLLAAAAAAAAPPGVGLPAGAQGTSWYVVNVLGRRGGYSQQTLRPLARAGQPGFASTEHTVLRLQMDGRTLTATRDEYKVYDADLRLLRLEHNSDQFGLRTRLVAERRGAVLHVVKTSPEGEKAQDLSLPEDFGRELEPLAALGAGRFAPGKSFTFTTFDSDLGAVDTIELTVVAHETAPQTCWKLEARSALLKVKTYSWVSEAGALLRQEVPDVMNLSLELATEQEALKGVSPLLLSSSVPVDRELGPPQQLAELALEIRSRVGGAADMFATTPRQTVRPTDGGAVLTVQAAAAPAAPSPLPLTIGPELAPYLVPGDMVQSEDANLRDQARAILAGETDAWQAVGKFRQWVFTTLRKVSSEPRPISALEILKQREGDCTEHAILMAALCQAAGIPVKMVAGLAYDRRAFHYHAWNEVYVGSWVETDATWNEPLVDAGHLQVAASALDSTSLSRMSLTSGRTMGTIEIKVLDSRSRL